MGLTNTSNRTSKIVTIVRGKFTIRLPEGVEDEKAVERTLEKGANAGKVIKELQYTGIEGTIKGTFVDESEWGTNYITELEDDTGSRFKVQIPVDSQFFGQYAKRMPNIDKTQPLFLGLGYDRERERHFLFIKQNGTNVPMKFTKDSPNGMPSPTKKTVKGKEVWDWEEQENFLYEIAMDFSSYESGYGEEDKEDIPF